MKFLIAISLLFFSFSSHADNSHGGIRDLLDDLNREVAIHGVEHLSPSDQAQIRYHLEEALHIVHDEGSTSELLCLVSSHHSSYFRLFNGQKEIGNDLSKSECLELKNSARLGLVVSRSLQHSSYYNIYTVQTGEPIGNYGSKSTMVELLGNTNNGMVCATSLEHSSYYSLYNILTSQPIGRYTSKSKCLQLVNESTPRYTCAVSTNHSSYYSVYEIHTGKRLGGDVSLSTCLETLQGRNK